MTGINYLLMTIILFFLHTEVIAEPEEYQLKALESHNTNRAKHDCPLLKLNDTLNQIAVVCAEYYVRLGDIDHSCKEKSGYGENLYLSGNDSPNNSIYHAVEASNDWYNEVTRFDWENPIACMYLKFMRVGHFTQVVWKGTKQLGIGYFENIEGKNISVVVGVYSGTAQNYEPEVKENVPPPNTSPSVVPQWLATLFAVGLFIMIL